MQTWVEPLAVGLLAIVVRIGAAADLRHDPLGISDPQWFRLQGIALTQGRGFVDPLAWGFCGVETPGAQHPPAFSAYLGAAYRLGLHSELSARAASLALGVVTAVVITLLARRLGGWVAGLAAGTIAAVYPYFWSTEVLALSEALFVLLVVLVLYAAWAYAERPRTSLMGAMALLIALATLTRAEAVLLFVLLALPLAWRSGTQRVRQIGVLGAVAIVALGPWVAYNLSRFEGPVIVSNGLGVTLAGANCEQSYAHDAIEGWWSLWCLPQFVVRPDGELALGDPTTATFDYCESPQVTADEYERDRLLRDHALGYARDNIEAVPRVAFARVGRMWALYHPVETSTVERVEGRHGSLAALIGFLALVPLGIAGGMLLHKRRVTVLPAVAVLVMVAFTGLVTYGHPRFRLAGDAALVVLSGVAVAGAVARMVHPRTLPARFPAAAPRAGS